MELDSYLKTTLALSTAQRYRREIDAFFLSLEKQNINPKIASYSQIMDYIGSRRKHYKKASSLSCVLHSIKHYYKYLILIKQRNDNPASAIRLRDKQSRDIQLQDLFSCQELELLLERKERYQMLKNRNKIVLSLLIYQGLTNGDLKNLELKDLDLEQGSVYIKSTPKTNARTLKLKTNQLYWIMQYLSIDRPKMIKERTEKLIISKLGTAETGEGIHYITETARHLFKGRKLNPKTIRQSVIANLLKSGHDLLIVQAFAGHKYPSTTENYRQTEVEELKNKILKHHPLG